MKPLLYLAPNLALFIVLYRMVGARLHVHCWAVYLFLCGWLIYSLTALMYTAVHPVSSPGYAAMYFRLTCMAWLLALPAIFQATAQLVRRPAAAWSLLAVVAVVAAAAWLIQQLFQRPGGGSLSTTALGLTAFAAALAGAIFLFAGLSTSLATSHSSLMFRGIGAYFLVFSFGSLAARAWGNSYRATDVVLLAGVAVWLLLAWWIAPTGDALVNEQKLAVIGFGFSRAARKAQCATHELPALSPLVPLAPHPLGAPAGTPSATGRNARVQLKVAGERNPRACSVACATALPPQFAPRPRGGDRG